MKAAPAPVGLLGGVELMNPAAPLQIAPGLDVAGIVERYLEYVAQQANTRAGVEFPGQQVRCYALDVLLR